jgi:type IV pilus assembly protein PilB
VHNGKDIIQVLLDYGIYTNEDEFWAQVADELGAIISISTNFEPPPSVVALIPAGMARLYGAFRSRWTVRGCMWPSPTR